MVALRKRRHASTNEQSTCRKRYRPTSAPSSSQSTSSTTQRIPHDNSSQTTSADATTTDTSLFDDSTQDISSTNTTPTSEDSSPSRLSISSGQDTSKLLAGSLTPAGHEIDENQYILESPQEPNTMSIDDSSSLESTISKAALLPMEIILSIIDHTPDQKMLNSWKLVSKKCAYYADLKLWSVVHINLTEGKMDRASQILDLLIEDDCRRMPMVRRLSVQGHIWRHTAPRIHAL